MKKLLRKKKETSVPETPVPESPEEREPATLTAMALAGARIGRRDDSAMLQEAAGQPAEADDSRDFFSAIKGTVPLNGKGRDVPVEPEPPVVPVTDPRHPLQDFMEGKVEFSVASTDEYAEGHVVGLDLMIVSQLQSRQFSPEAHIDLHGLNCEQAFQNLVGFFRSSYYKGVRTVLVVTGRGLNSLNGVPVLRFRVQQWLTQDPFKRVVLAFCTARQEDGGAGAFYVLLRRRKKSYGKIHWDVMPSDPDLYICCLPGRGVRNGDVRCRAFRHLRSSCGMRGRRCLHDEAGGVKIPRLSHGKGVPCTMHGAGSAKNPGRHAWFFAPVRPVLQRRVVFCRNRAQPCVPAFTLDETRRLGYSNVVAACFWAVLYVTAPFRGRTICKLLKKIWRSICSV